MKPEHPFTVLKCSACGKLTTSLEAAIRIARTGRCGHCGGHLETREEHDSRINREDDRYEQGKPDG